LLQGFIQGLVIRVWIAAPVGPIESLCIQRTLAKDRAFGLITGLGAATADTLCGAIAGFGITYCLYDYGILRGMDVISARIPKGSSLC
jgi:threonine/homoserine/homoserine lactone efflux protein